MRDFFVTSASRALVDINRDTVCFSVVSVINFEHRQGFAFQTIAGRFPFNLFGTVAAVKERDKMSACDINDKQQQDKSIKRHCNIASVKCNAKKPQIHGDAFHSYNLLKSFPKLILGKIKIISRQFCGCFNILKFFPETAVSGRNVRCPALSPAGCALLSECHSQGAPVIGLLRMSERKGR